MEPIKPELYREFTQLANDYGNPTVATNWAQLRSATDVHCELDPLGLNHNDVLLDIGCGAADHLVAAAQKCQRVHGIDISDAMLAIATKKIKQLKLSNATVSKAGFLTYAPDIKTLPYTCIFSWGALHHLPDFWKAVAFRNMYSWLSSEGKLLISDFAYSFSLEKYEVYQSTFLESVVCSQGKETAISVGAAMRDEFITFRWILEELLTQCGFELCKVESNESKCWTTILAQKG